MLRLLPILVLLVSPMAAPARADTADPLRLRSGRLTAQVSLAPWRLRFVDRSRGELLVEHSADGAQPSGPVGFRTAEGWAHALRAVSHERRRGRLSLLLETSDPDGRRMRVELRRAGHDAILLPPDVDTLADYGESSAELVKLADRRDALHLLAFPRGRSHARFYHHGRIVSTERHRAWEIWIRGGDVRSFDLQASLATLKQPFEPCSVRWRGRRLAETDWDYDPETRALRTHFEGDGGRLHVRACSGARGWR